MRGPTLKDLENAYQDWVSAPTRTFRLRARAPQGDGPPEMDIHAFDEAGDDPFVYIATAGMSAQDLAGPVPRVELLLVVAGRLDQAQFEALARRLGELAAVPFRQHTFFAPNMVIDGFSFPLFDRMKSVLFADFNIRSADYLPIEPPIRVLRVTPLFEAEAALARELGDVDLYHRFEAEDINHQDPRRRQLELSTPPGPESEADMQDEIASIWSDIEGWLGVHAAPTLAALRAGADAAAIESLERTLGVQLPAAYRASLMRHDGRAYLTDYEYLSSAQIIRIWTSKKQAFDRGEFAGRDVANKGSGRIRNFWWHPGWIPFAEDSAGNLRCIDTVPGPQGTQGQIVHWEREEGPLPGPETSFHDWLQRYRDDLLAGKRYEVDPDGLIRIAP